MQRDNVAVIERHRYLEVLHEFTMRQASMKSVDDICWNIAKTAIGELGFVDCVVYLMNEAHSELIQRAAHGNKNPGEREILDPIDTLPYRDDDRIHDFSLTGVFVAVSSALNKL